MSYTPYAASQAQVQQRTIVSQVYACRYADSTAA
jgi:hypothetical protein